jgi:hypothetical protein
VRTAYGPESNVWVTLALEGLYSYVRWWLHSGRLSAFGALYEERRVDFDKDSEELSRQFYIKVIDDREGLAYLDVRRAAGDTKFTTFRRVLSSEFTRGGPGWPPEYNLLGLYLSGSRFRGRGVAGRACPRTRRCCNDGEP